MRYLSVCSGIEAVSVAWKPLGFEPVGFSEIDPFACAVLKERFPGVVNYGNMEGFDDWNLEFDVLVGGTPCQSFSVAGLREGLKDPRGNLCLTYVAIANKFRPKYFVWENVPGVLSSSGGRDFGTFLGAMVELGYSVSWRILDAKYFGVPQRRRRVFVVGYLGDWRRSAEVLFEREGVPRNLEQGSEEIEEDSSTVARCLNTSGYRLDASVENFVAFSCKDYTHDAGPISPTLRSMTHSGSHANGGGQVAICIQGTAERMNLNAGPAGCGWKDDNSSFTLNTVDRHAVCFNARQDPVSSNKALPLDTDGTSQGVLCFAENSRAELRLEGGDGQTTGSLSGPGGKPGQGYPAIATTSTVRRLTPLECERLQGLPDNWTNITYKGKPAKDGPRYKAIGNSMAVPVLSWIGKRLLLSSLLD